MPVKNLFALLAVVVVTGGCRTSLMKTPAVVADGQIDPFLHVLPERQNTSAPVFVASSRTVSGSTNPAQFYTTDRSREVRLGLATVEFGEGLTWEELTEVSRATKRSRNPVSTPPGPDRTR